jgi:hypothetical protein
MQPAAARPVIGGTAVSRSDFEESDMSVFVKLLTGAAGLAAAVGFASPAAAQYYPGYGYNQGGGVVGAIINGVIGSGQYGYGNYGYGNYGGNDRFAVDQCSRAVEARLSGGYGRYGGYGYNNYNRGGRVVGITRVERRNNGLRVRGVATTGGYGGYGGGSGNIAFSCKVDYRGRIVDLDFNRQNYGYNQYYRGY